jgi:hypothetical protein
MNDPERKRYLKEKIYTNTYAYGNSGVARGRAIFTIGLYCRVGKHAVWQGQWLVLVHLTYEKVSPRLYLPLQCCCWL